MKSGAEGPNRDDVEAGPWAKSTDGDRPEPAGRTEPSGTGTPPRPPAHWSSAWTPILAVGLACLIGAAFFIANSGSGSVSPSPSMPTGPLVARPGRDSPTATPTPTLAPTPAQGPVVLSVFSVPVASPNGYVFVAPQTGEYLFRYAGGAYSTYPPGVNPPKPSWLTSACADTGGNVPWTNGLVPAAGPNCSFVVGWTGAYYRSAAEAGAAAQAMAEQTAPPSFFAPPAIALQIGDRIVFRAVDDEAAYPDNQGTLTISASLL
jgi:hypothetical protein